jgi:hypothetical protein
LAIEDGVEGDECLFQAEVDVGVQEGVPGWVQDLYLFDSCLILVDFDIDDALQVLDDVVQVVLDEKLRDALVLLLHVVEPVDVRADIPLEGPATSALREDLQQTVVGVHVLAFTAIDLVL